MTSILKYLVPAVLFAASVSAVMPVPTVSAQDLCSLDTVSSPATQANRTGETPHNAVVVPTQPEWVPIPPGINAPDFIWSNNPANASDQAEFRLGVTWYCLTSATGTLYVNGDDGYSASWNGVGVASCHVPVGDQSCFRSYKAVNITLSPGLNTLVIDANNANIQSQYGGYPAMVQFRIYGRA